MHAIVGSGVGGSGGSGGAGLLAFLRTAGQLKRVKRSGWLRSGVAPADCESVADHSWRIAVMALVLGDAELGVDGPRALRMALLHDVQEALVGDIMPPQHSGVSEQDKHQLERDAIAKLRAMLGRDNERLGDELVSLWSEYEAGQTPTARLVKDLDKAEMLLQADAYERSGAPSLQDFYDSAMPRIVSPTVRSLVQAVLDERRAKVD